MALPVAHSALAFGLGHGREFRVLAFLALLSVAPDFDFAFVWVFGLPVATFHRTFSHSLVFAVLMAGLWRFRPQSCADVPARLIFATVLSHGIVDMACTADAADHGVWFLWPASIRFGGPLLVPLYRMFAETPFTVEGALRFTLLEALLAPGFFALGLGAAHIFRIRRQVQ